MSSRRVEFREVYFCRSVIWSVCVGDGLVDGSDSHSVVTSRECDKQRNRWFPLYQVSHLHLSDFETTSLPTKHVVCTLETRGVGDVDEIPTLVIHTLSQS